MPPFNRGENHLFPLYVIDCGWMQTARGQRLPIQTIWTGSAAAYFGLNQSLEDRRGPDKGQEHVIDVIDTFGTGKIKSWVRRFLMWHHYCCDFWSVAEPSLTSEAQVLKLSDSAPPLCLEKYLYRWAQVCVQCPLEAVLNWSLIGNSRLQNVCFSEHLVVARSVPMAAWTGRSSGSKKCV